MYHLTPEELLDLAEATRPEVSSKSMSHLAACAVCRDQLADLRAALELVDPADVHVPEPSPLFWEHFSTRVREAVASDVAPRRSWRERWLSWKIALPAAACLAALIAATVMFRTTSEPPATAQTETIDPAADSVGAAVDDPSWDLMTNLAADLDWEAAAEAGLTPSAGGVDRAIFDLNADERRELQRLLQEELSRSGV